MLQRNNSDRTSHHRTHTAGTSTAPRTFEEMEEEDAKMQV